MLKRNGNKEEVDVHSKNLCEKSYKVLFFALGATSLIGALVSLYNEFFGVFILAFAFIFFGGEISYKILRGIFSKQ